MYSVIVKALRLVYVTLILMDDNTPTLGVLASKMLIQFLERLRVSLPFVI